MDETLPSEFDLIVVGTGFSESIIAAAASRIGKSVLHLDPNEFYGSSWSSFNLEAFQKLINDCNTFITTEKSDTLKIVENFCDIVAAKQKWHIENIPESETEMVEEEEDTSTTTTIKKDEWTKEKVIKEFRKFNIDLTPKLLFGVGKLVQLLITSNICRYAEFRAVDKICTIYEGQVKSVPCSRTDVFNTKDLTIVEKRLLMKLLTQCMTYEDKPEEFKEFENKTFLEFLKANHLTEKIIHSVLIAISMSNENTSLAIGMERTKNFLHSLGRYGNTPFLFPMYGCGEIPQCFCRLCAVFGGIYCLKKSIDNIKILNDEEKCAIEIVCGTQKIKTEKLVIGKSDIPNGLFNGNRQLETNIKNKCGKLSRAIFISSTPIGDSTISGGGGGVNLLRLPDDVNSNGALIIHLSHFSGTCPKDLYLIHITCESKTDNPETDLKPYIDELLNLENPINILYSAYFQIPECKNCQSDGKLNIINDNIYLTCGPYFEIDYDLSIENAKNIFTKMYPNDEFLPRAPDPEEIIIGDEDPTAVKGENEDDASLDLNNITEQIREIEEVIENQVKCIEENTQNEDKDLLPHM